MEGRLKAYKQWAAFGLCLVFLTCCGFGGCSGSQIRKFKVANADLSSGLSRLTTTTIQLSQQGTLTTDEAKVILPKVSDATVLSDKMEQCANAVSAKTTLVGCVTPLLKAVRDDVDQASLGVKSPSAQATMASALAVAIASIDAIARLGAQ